MQSVRAYLWLLLVAGGVLATPTVLALDGPEQEIEELSERIKFEGESTELLLRRAVEFNLLGKGTEALKDIERAVELDPLSVPAHEELGRTSFQLGKTNEALAAVTRALKKVAGGKDSAMLLALRAEFYSARGENSKALDDVEQALRENPSHTDGYLLRSRLHARLKLKKERVLGLQEGVEKSGAGILQAEWVDALIEDGQYELALPKVEAELANTRLRSAWLIRRAKILLAQGAKDKAKLDLESAIEELDRRIQTATPEPTLLADRGVVQDLLGHNDEARKDYQAAQDKGVGNDALKERLRVLKKAAEPDAEDDGK